MSVPGADGVERVILYDGECGICDRLVRFVLPRDPRGVFRFAALQSDYARRALSRAGLPTDDFQTMVLIEEGRVYLRSSAGLRVLRRLSGLWPALYPLIAVPRPLRDFLYRLVAENRHRLRPKNDSCPLSATKWSQRFLS